MNSEEDILVLTNDEGRTCTRCLRVLPLDCFYRKRKAHDTYQPWCKDCQKDYAVRRRTQVEFRKNELSSYTLKEITLAIENVDKKTLNAYKTMVKKLENSIDRKLSERKRTKRKNLR